VKLTVNDREYEVEAGGDEKLLWVLRDRLMLTGTKFGCGIGRCGCCTVLVDGKATRSCVTPLSSVLGKKITTIEGIPEGHPVKRAWLELQVPQCGYCQSGQIMQAVSLLSENPRPSEDDIREGMNGNLCRCGTYERITKAVKRASELRESREKKVAEKSPAREYALNRWVRLSEDGRVVILLNKSEMGQGVSTALPQIVSEEMDADWDLVSFEFSPAEEEYNDPAIGAMETGGSTSVRDMLEEMKKAGAAARGKILKAASSVLGVSASELRTENGRVIHGDRSLSYGELAELASVQEEGGYEIKDLQTKELQRKDLESKVNGRAVFGIDVSVPGMVYATVIRAPAYGADLVSYKSIEGKTVRISNGIGVYADSIEEAWKARDEIQAEWGKVALLDDENIDRTLEDALNNVELYGERGKAEGETLLEARYKTQYISHAPMEPMNCVVWVKENECEVWAPTQVQTEAVEAARDVTGMKDVQLHTTFLGGGFGRRLKSDFIREAAEISMKIKRPVKLLWTREEDLAYDFYRPGAVADMRARMHKGAVGMECRVAVQRVHEEGTEKEADPATVAGIWNTLYSIKDMRVEYGRVALPLRAGPWRSVGNSNNAFFMESFMDEVAVALKKDPLEFRLSMLEDERAKNVLRKVAEMSHWGRSMAAGCAQGLAFHYSFGSYCAEVAEVSIEDRIKVDRVFVAIDCGRTINRGIIKQQVEGAVIMGLSVALRERMSFGDSFAITQNFDSYRLLRMEDVPRTEILIVDSDASAGGVGEPALPPVAPAVANAVFRAGGGRLRNLPLHFSDIRK